MPADPLSTIVPINPEASTQERLLKGSEQISNLVSTCSHRFLLRLDGNQTVLATQREMIIILRRKYVDLP